MSNQTKGFLLSLSLILFGPMAQAQSEETYKFSLQEAQAYAVENSYQTRLAEMEVEKSKKKVNETIGTGLPQVNASASYQNFFTVPTQVIPAEAFGGPAGEFAEVQFGIEQNMGFDATVSQLIFDGSYFVGLQASKVYLELSKNDKTKSEIEVKNMVLNAYGTFLVAEQNAKIQEEIYGHLENNFKEAEARFEEGFLSQEDKDQLELLYLNARNSYQQSVRQLPIVSAQLKYILGISLEANLELTDSLFPLLEQMPQQEFLDKEFNVESHIDYRIVSTQLEASELQLKQKRSLYLPSLNAYYTYQENSFSNDFDFFSGASWFPTNVLGVNMNIPIFSGLSRHNQVAQAKLEMQQLDLSKKQVEQQLQINVDRARSDYLFALQQFENRKANWKLAQRIYNNTEIKYREGLSSSTDLTQANNQLDESLGNYVQAALQLLNAKAQLNKALNIN